MLSKVGKTLRSWVVGDSDKGLSTTKKRQRDETEDDVIVTHTKRSKLSHDAQVSQSKWPIGKLAEWVVRSKKTFEQSYYFREIARRASPRRIIEGLTSQSSGGKHTNGNNQGSQSGTVHPLGTYPNMDPSRGWGPPNANQGQFKMPPPKPPSGRPMEPHGMRPPLHRDAGLRPPPQSGNTSYNGLPRPHVAVRRSAYDTMYNTIQRQRTAIGYPMTGEPVSRPQTKLAAKESIRMDEKQRYAQLLQQWTNVPLSASGTTNSHLRRDKKTAVPKRDRTVLGTDISQLRERTRPAAAPVPETPLQEVTPRPRSASPEQPPAVQEDILLGLTERSYSGLQQRRQGDGASEQLSRSSMSISRSASRSDEETPCTWRGKKAEPQWRPAPLSFDDDSPVIILDSPSSSPVPRSPVVEEFEKSLRECQYTEDWLNDVTSKFSDGNRRRSSQIQEEQVKLKYFAEKREEWEKQLEQRIRHKLKLSARESPVEEYTYEESSESEEEEEEEEDEFPELTDDQEGLVNHALRPQPAGEVLAEGFRLQIRRSDMDTLRGLNWLNDEIVNFYFELLRERGKQEDFPSVHVFNTFFYPKVKSQGQQGVRRWTKSVDIYTFDYVAIPIHLGMHWCLAVIDFKKKAVRYFDSMGGKNMECLNLLKKYLEDEHKQKKGTPYDMSDWTLENVTGLPQQMNGSDCGVFTCKYADYVTRSRPISFTQANMPYFRRRMVYEIMSKKLMS